MTSPCLCALARQRSRARTCILTCTHVHTLSHTKSYNIARCPPSVHVCVGASMQGRAKEGTARWEGVVSAVNALGDGKQTSFSLRQGTKEEKDLLDKVLVVSLLPWCDSCLLTLGVTFAALVLVSLVPLPYARDFQRSFLSHSGLLPLHPCLSTPGSLGSDSCVLESLGRRLA
jgi:hypothetical protein